MRLDSHQHFWSFRESEYDWIDERMGRIRRDFAPGDLEPILRRNDFDGSVAVQVRQSLEETEYLLGLAEDHDFIRGVVGWVDLCSPGVRRDLERLSEHPRFRGVRHIVQAEPDDRFLLREDFLRGVELLRDLDLTYDILVYHRHLPVVVDFVARFPEHRLVLDHIGKPAIAKAELEPWASSIRKLGKSENLYCKVSGLVTEADWSGWKRPWPSGRRKRSPDSRTPAGQIRVRSFAITSSAKRRRPSRFWDSTILRISARVRIWRLSSLPNGIVCPSCGRIQVSNGRCAA